jgi:hypothetical protein
MPFAVETSVKVQGLVNAVIEDGQFDVTPTQALRWLNSRQKQMTARSACYRKTLSLGNTVEGQATYAVPADVVRVLQVTVAEFPYPEVRHIDFTMIANGWEVLIGEGGVMARDDSGAGNAQIRISPTPGNESQPLSIYAIMLSPDLVLGDDTTLVVPPDYYDALIAGAIGTGSRGEARYDIAGTAETAFAASCEELNVATRRKFHGRGPARIRVQRSRRWL